MSGPLRTVLMVGLALVPCFAQDQPAAQPAGQILPPEQLESLVAPMALYSDSLLSQVLVASTYPLELVEAGQWLQQNSTLTGEALVDAAKQQTWDPSIQALVPFADVIKRLTSDVRWTTDLGNAFLSQQADVMAAIQRLRARAKASGKLTDTPQQKIVDETKDGQSAIQIQPVDPQVVYVPVYDPGYFWDPYPMWPWPPLFYPGIGVGWRWGLGINLGFYFGGCCGWGGWGWGPNWFGGGIYINNHFFHRYSYAEFHGSEFHANSAWEHNPAHRGAVPYPHGVASRYEGARAAGNARREGRPNASSVRSNLSRPSEARANNHSAFGGVSNGSRARMQSDHGASSMGSRSFGGSRGGGGGGSRGRGR